MIYITGWTVMRKSEFLLTVVALLSTVTGFWLWGELRTERARNAELSARLASLPSPIAAPESAAPAPIFAPASPAVATSASNFATTPSPPESKPRNIEIESLRLALQETRYREAWRAQMRLNYARRRENAIRLVGLTSEEAEAAVEIAIDRQLSWVERPPQELAVRDAALDLIEQAKREDDAKLLGLLGEQKFARFQEYMESRSTRIQVDQLRPQFTGEEAIREDQVEPLIAALHVEHARLRSEQQEYRRAASENFQPDQQYDREIELLEAAHGRMHAAAAPILSDSQLTRFDTLLKRDLERQKLELRMSGNSPDPDDPDTD